MQTIIKRSFGYSPAIRFIGKRSLSNFSVLNTILDDKSIGINEPTRPKHVEHATPAHTQQSTANPFKALSPNCVVQVSQSVPAFGGRAKLSKEEIDAINNGGVDVNDWRKIKM